MDKKKYEARNSLRKSNARREEKKKVAKKVYSNATIYYTFVNQDRFGEHLRYIHTREHRAPVILQMCYVMCSLFSVHCSLFSDKIKIKYRTEH